MNLNIFRRITSSGNYIAQLDGLRFIAITSVIIFHIDSFLTKLWLYKTPGFYSPLVSAFSTVSKTGFFGVQLFFAISGYILSEPLWKKSNFSYKHYLERRVSRIEPPFLICAIFFTLVLHLVNRMSFHSLWLEFLTTILYVHNITSPHRFSIVCGVSWSLEVEVQFYLLIPLIILLIKKVKPKLTVLLILFVLFQIMIEITRLDIYSLVNYINYFWVGVIISCLKKCYPGTKPNIYFPGCNFILLCLIFLSVYGLLNTTPVLLNRLILMLRYGLLFLLFYNVLVLEKGIRFLSGALVSTIGGMCYTIYLIHYPVINIAGYFMLKAINPHLNTWLYFSVTAILFIASVGISACLFLVIEKPFMKKEWYKYGFGR